MLAAHLQVVSHAGRVNQVTDLVARLGRGEGLDKPVVFTRDMENHTLEKNIKVVKDQVSLMASVELLNKTYVVSVNKDPKGSAKDSKEVSRALARALTVSCLGEDLKAMVETHNGLSMEPVTFDELVHWMKGEVGGKYPLSSFRDGLRQEFAGKEWGKDVLHLRLAELKQMEGQVANALALYMESHQPYLCESFKTFDHKPEDFPEDGGADSSLEAKLEKEANVEAQFAVWRAAEDAKLEDWMIDDNFRLLLAKAQADAKVEVEEYKALVEKGQAKGPAMKYEQAWSEKLNVLMAQARAARKELEERGAEKMKELREALMEPRGAPAAQGKGLRVSVEKLRFQKEDVAGCLIGEKMMDWIVLEGNSKQAKGERMEPKRPFRLTKFGRSNVYRLCLPSWLRKRLYCLNDKGGVTFALFEFMCRREIVKAEDERDSREKPSKPKSKSSKGQPSAGANKKSSPAPIPSSSSSSSKKEQDVLSSSARNKMDRFLEHGRHTVAKDKLDEYLQVGKGKSNVEEKREKLQWLVRDAKALGYTSWSGPYAQRLEALNKSTQSAGKGGFSYANRGKGGGRGGSTMGRGGGKGGRGGGNVGKGGGPGRGGAPDTQGPRRSSRATPAPGFYKGMQALTLTDTHTQPPAPQPAYHPYQHLTPYYPYYNPYVLPPPTQVNHYETTHVTTDDTQNETGEAKPEETGVMGWDEQNQVATDAEEEPQYSSWADAESYNDYYGGRGQDSDGEEDY